MSWQQIAVIVFIAMEIGGAIVKNGEPKKGTHSFWQNAFAWGLLVYFLWSGGFWK